MKKTKNWEVKMNKVILPIDAYREQILASIKENPVTVIVAETGAGKSTQVPQYLLKEGYDLVVTQPRRLAARSVAARVAEEWGEELGQTIGYRTAVDRVDSPATRCLFCTDGLALVRELLGQNKGVLVLDEVHEWNENMEVLVAWVKSQIAAGTDMRVVLMSATLESEKLSAFFNNAPIISVPGRTFPVEDRTAGQNVETDVATLVAEGRNVLVFQPGQQEINETIAKLLAKNVSAVILPLHGQLEPKDQAKCFMHYGKPKVVVSTNVAQTSVTIDDIDAVVDSGLERRIELVDGVEGLYLKPISQADAKQRKGRAGRVKAGIYIDHCPSSSRPDFPVAEIMRKRLDQTVLRLAIAGFDMEVMEFFHQPAKSDIHDARQTLIGLGCMTADGQVTKMGRLINKLPVSVKYGRMLVEADRLGVVEDVLTVAAIMEIGGITIPTPSRNQPDRPDWRKMVPEEKESDIMGQLKVWQLARTMNEAKMKESGISMRSFFRAKEIRQHLSEALRSHFRFGTNGKRENILKSICAGMVDHLFKNQFGSYKNGDDTTRDLGSASLVSGADWVVGNPFDLQIQTRRGSMTLHLIELASKVNPSWLAEIAPHLVSKKVEKLYWSNEQNCVVEDHVTIFNGIEIDRKAKACEWSTEALKIFVVNIMNSYYGSNTTNEIFEINKRVMNQYDEYCVRSGGVISQKDSIETIRELYTIVLEPYKILSFSALENLFETKQVSKESLILNLHQFISEEEINSIEVNNPLTIKIGEVEFPVKYHRSNSVFYPLINKEVTEEFITEIQPEQLILPSGRELKIYFQGYTKSLAEHLASIEQARIENIERAQRDLVSNFKNQISSILAVPQVMPFFNPNSGWNGNNTNLGENLKSRFESQQSEMIAGLTLENFDERVEMVKTKAEEIKTEMCVDYDKANALISDTEESFSRTLAEVNDEFIQEEINEASGFIHSMKTSLQKGEFAEVNDMCAKAQSVVGGLKSISDSRTQEREELLRKSNVPAFILSAFHGNLENALQFMSNVAKLETYRLDEHEITCGRSRARHNMEDAWIAMGEESDFFIGADPNDVKYYVYDYHFGSGDDQYEEDSDIDEISEVDSSNDRPVSAEDLARLLNKFH